MASFTGPGMGFESKESDMLESVSNPIRKGRPARLPPDQRHKLRTRIQQYVGLGQENYRQIADRVTKEGFRSATGGPILASYVSQIILLKRLQAKRRRLKAKAVSQEAPLSPQLKLKLTPAPPAKPLALPAAVLAILDDAMLSDAKKVRMVRAYADA
jgi:hypothetical protein